MSVLVAAACRFKSPGRPVHTSAQDTREPPASITLLTAQAATRCLHPHMTRHEFVPLFMIARPRINHGPTTRVLPLDRRVWSGCPHRCANPCTAPHLPGAAQRANPPPRAPVRHPYPCSSKSPYGLAAHIAVVTHAPHPLPLAPHAATGGDSSAPPPPFRRPERG